MLQIEVENAKIILKVFNRDILKSQFSSSDIQIILIFIFYYVKNLKLILTTKIPNYTKWNIQQLIIYYFIIPSWYRKFIYSPPPQRGLLVHQAFI